jgi:hypothetical protein
MQVIALVVTCFLFICSGHHYRKHHHVRHYHSVEQTTETPAAAQTEPPTLPRPVPAPKPLSSVCSAIVDAFDNSRGLGVADGQTRDKFVTKYPVPEQHRVIECLEKSGRGQ